MTRLQQLRKLEARLVKATCADRALDRDIALAIGWRMFRGRWKNERNETCRDLWKFTGSIDAALTLVPEGMRYGVCEMQSPTTPQPPRFHGWVIPRDSCLADDEIEGYSEASPAIAFCLAATRALIAQETNV